MQNDHSPRAVDVRLLEPQSLDIETLQRAFKRAGKEGRRWQVLFDAVVREVESLRRARRAGQRFAATKARDRDTQLKRLGVASVDELIARYQTALVESERVARQSHERAVRLSCESIQNHQDDRDHTAQADVEDALYFAFESCRHADCLRVRALLADGPAVPADLEPR